MMKEHKTVIVYSSIAAVEERGEEGQEFRSRAQLGSNGSPATCQSVGTLEQITQLSELLLSSSFNIFLPFLVGRRIIIS